MSLRKFGLSVVCSAALIACGGPAEPDAEADPVETEEAAAATTPDAAGGCSSDAECTIDEYCAFSHATCGGQGPGVCVGMPDSTACDAAGSSAVCGCDGFTYETGCSAASSGASVAHEGPCPTAPPPSAPSSGGCGGLSCGASEYCDYDDGSCGSGSVAGACRAEGAVCTSVEEPTCGCDGTTYTSRCAAQRAGVSVDHLGAC